MQPVMLKAPEPEGGIDEATFSRDGYRVTNSHEFVAWVAYEFRKICSSLVIGLNLNLKRLSFSSIFC